MSLAERLIAGESVTVRTRVHLLEAGKFAGYGEPTGQPFTIKSREFAGVRGYGVFQGQSKRPYRGYPILSKGDVETWAESLAEV